MVRHLRGDCKGSRPLPPMELLVVVMGRSSIAHMETGRMNVAIDPAVQNLHAM